MNKEDEDLYVYIYLHTHTQREILLSYEKRNLAICNNEDGSIRYYVKRNGKERQVPHDLSYM